jgi:hypothetical protein
VNLGLAKFFNLLENVMKENQKRRKTDDKALPPRLKVAYGSARFAPGGHGRGYYNSSGEKSYTDSFVRIAVFFGRYHTTLYSSFQNKNGTADLVYDGPIFLGCRLVVLSFFLYRHKESLTVC